MKSSLFLTRMAILALAALSALAGPPLRAETRKADLVGEPNPPAPGFLVEESDPEAIALADRVMLRLGGRNAWDRTRFITWKFFGDRFHVWDKHTGDIRLEGVDGETQAPYTILMNLKTKNGRAWRSGVEVTAPEPLAELLDLGEAAWINDSYWMFMPFKLKDSGVALRALGEGALLDGRPADVLELTFREIGRTPKNKYHVYVARDTGLVAEWAYFTDASDETPRIRSPWRNWRRHGSILLSDDRGSRRHTDIEVFDQLPAEVFTSPEAIDLSSQQPAPTGNLLEAPIYTVEGDVMKPQLVRSAKPEYPKSARKAGTTGRVVVRTVIGADGTVRDARIAVPLDESLDQAALDAVREWEFEPATLGGAPVAIYYDLTINFELDGDAKPRESKTPESN